MAFDVIHESELEWLERESADGSAPRRYAVVTDAANLTESRARMWRYPAHVRGRRHVDRTQEEVFVPLRGTLTLLLEDPPQRVDVEPGGMIAVHPGRRSRRATRRMRRFSSSPTVRLRCKATWTSSTTSQRFS